MRWPEKHFIVCEPYRFLYIPIEKVACSAIKSWIIGLVEGAEAARGVDPNGHARARYELQALSPDMQRRQLADEALFRFAFVRNPWDRLISGFLNKFVPWKSPAERFVRQHIRRTRLGRAARWLSVGLFGARRENSDRWREELTFRQFVTELRERKPESFDEHWRPQHLFLGDQPLDFLGRFETLAADFRALGEQLGTPGVLPAANKTVRDHGVRQILANTPLAQLRQLRGFPEYGWFYTPDLVQDVADLYAEDVRRFGYDFQAPAARAA